MQDPDHTASYLKAADTRLSLLLKGTVPRLIDEWQMPPVLWDAVDEREESGQFILTGSAVPMDNAVQHTGTGRISHILMRPMSLYESLESNGSVSLNDLFDGNADVEAISELFIGKIAFVLARGGWPDSIGTKENIALHKAYDYVDAVINLDISRVDNIERDPTCVRALMRSNARNIASMATVSTIQNDIAGAEGSINDKTITSYLNALRRIFVVED